jgi:hypothetical protein
LTCAAVGEDWQTAQEGQIRIVKSGRESTNIKSEHNERSPLVDACHCFMLGLLQRIEKREAEVGMQTAWVGVVPKYLGMNNASHLGETNENP